MPSNPIPTTSATARITAITHAVLLVLAIAALFTTRTPLVLRGCVQCWSSEIARIWTCTLMPSRKDFPHPARYLCLDSVGVRLDKEEKIAFLEFLIGLLIVAGVLYDVFQ